MKCDIWSLGITIAQIYMGIHVNSNKKYLRNPFWQNINPVKADEIHKFYKETIR